MSEVKLTTVLVAAGGALLGWFLVRYGEVHRESAEIPWDAAQEIEDDPEKAVRRRWPNLEVDPATVIDNYRRKAHKLFAQARWVTRIGYLCWFVAAVAAAKIVWSLL